MSEDTSISDNLLSSCYDKYENGYFTDLEKEFNSIPQETTFQGIPKVKHDILQAFLLSTKGDYSSSEKIASTALQKSIEAGSSIHIIDSYLILMEVYENTEKFDDLADVIQKCESLLHNFENNDSHVIHRKIRLLYYNGRINWRKGQIIVAQQYFEEALEIAKNENKNKYDIAVCSRNVALVIDKIDKERSKSLQIEALQIFREINNPLELSNSLQNIATFIDEERDYNQALAYTLESLEVTKKLGNKNRIFWNLNNLGSLYFELDKFDLALEYYQKAYDIAKELNNNWLLLASYNLRLHLYIERGDLEKTEFLFKEFVKLQLINKPLKVILINFYKAHICRMKGQIQEALECAKKAIELTENNQNFTGYEGLISGYVWIINYSLELKDLDLANANLKRIKYYLDKTTDKKMLAIYEQYYKLGESMILKNNLRMKEKVKAQEFFESCIEDKGYTSWQKNLAMINLCDLYLDELSMYGDSRTLTDLNNLVAKMQKVASEKNSYYLMIKTNLIQARLALVEGKIQKAEQILSEALTLSKLKSLTILENEIKEEQAQLPEWHNYSNDSLSFNERLQKAQLTNYIKEAEKYIGLGKVN